VRKSLRDIVVDASGDGMSKEALAAWTRQHGAGVAAWLVWTYRRQILRAGAVDFDFEKGKAEAGPYKGGVPPWFMIAIEALKARPRSWQVVVRGMPTSRKRTWRVRWLRWGGAKEPLGSLGGAA
jgi:hypothetical protein